jgi:hypothetical protein
VDVTGNKRQGSLKPSHHTTARVTVVAAELTHSPAPAEAQPRARQPGPDRELLEAALAPERDARGWREEFTWLLAHPAISALTDRGHDGEPRQGLRLGSFATEHAARFPLVSGDAAWLAERSMTVVARRLAPLLAQGAEVSLDVSAVTRVSCTAQAQREQMRLLASGLSRWLPGALSRYGVAAGGLTLSARADHPGLSELLRLRDCAALGRPRIALRLPDRLLLSLRDSDGGATGWGGDPLQLWHGLTDLAHRVPGIHVVLQHTTRPACALAGEERTDAVLPRSLFETRADTAWPALRIALDRLLAHSPGTAIVELRRLLRASLRLADNLAEQLDWCSAELSQDALINRRVALHLTGFGELIDRWRLDPADFTSVDLAMRWVGVVRQLMLRESNALARERGNFPGLDLRDIESTLTRSLGDERARRLLRRAGLRHRHLLVMSPYGVFPAAASRCPLPAYLHLLPILRWADTVAMFGDGMARALPLDVWRRLLCTTWAIARNRP